MQVFILGIHNFIRWMVIVLGFVAVVKAFVGWMNNKEWTRIDRNIGLMFSISVDVQTIVGLLLYFVYSNLGLKALKTGYLSSIMSDGIQRFFAVEHGLLMVLGLAFVHLGSASPRKTESNKDKFRRASIYFLIALVLIVAGVPWSFRPLFPIF